MVQMDVNHSVRTFTGHARVHELGMGTRRRSGFGAVSSPSLRAFTMHMVFIMVDWGIPTSHSINARDRKTSLTQSTSAHN
jgi:hypothetical protein